MDFNTPQSALESLLRRQPSLPDEILQVSRTLIVGGNNNIYTDKLDEVVKLLVCERWEALAVGLLISKDIVQRWLFALNGEYGAQTVSSYHSGGVYAEGPRQPELIDDDGETNSNTNVNNAAAVDTEDIHEVHIEFLQLLISKVQMSMEHSEPRVRTLVAKTFGAFCKLATHSIRNKNSDHNKHHDTFKNMLDEISVYIYRVLMRNFEYKRIHENHSDSKDNTSDEKNDNKVVILDDTTGWRALETSWIALSEFVLNCNSYFMQHYYVPTAAVTIPATSNNNVSQLWFDEKLMNVLEQCCTKHINRHVRAAGLQCLEQILISLAQFYEEKQKHVDDTSFFNNNDDLVNQLFTPTIRILEVTLADNWSQVRMAASVTARVYLRTYNRIYGPQQLSEKVFPKLLPRMCLNRFYLAQGVKLYSHDTWKMIFDSTDEKFHLDGREEVAKHAGAVCRYYIKMCDADNHVVREGACQAIAELADRLNEYKDSLAPFVPHLLQALIMCFHDESWPVRDEACLACGTFVKAYPDECKDDIPLLFERWTDHLCDQIWSVREDAAVALGNAIRAYGQELLLELVPVLKKWMPLAKNQPAMTYEEYKARQNDIALHTDSQLYSCGSLAPKLKKRSHGGCSDCKVNREKAPWEATDGCVYMMRELCKIIGESREHGDRLNNTHSGLCSLLNDDNFLLPLMKELLDSCRVKHFPQSDDLRTTLWKQLPIMARGLGKQRFKRYYLDLFLDLLLGNISSRSAGVVSQNSVHAAVVCCEELAIFVGRGILRGRLMYEDQQADFDKCLLERELQQQTNKQYLNGGGYCS